MGLLLTRFMLAFSYAFAFSAEQKQLPLEFLFSLALIFSCNRSLSDVVSRDLREA